MVAAGAWPGRTRRGRVSAVRGCGQELRGSGGNLPERTVSTRRVRDPGKSRLPRGRTRLGRPHRGVCPVNAERRAAPATNTAVCIMSVRNRLNLGVLFKNKANKTHVLAWRGLQPRRHSQDAAARRHGAAAAPAPGPLLAGRGRESVSRQRGDRCPGWPGEGSQHPPPAKRFPRSPAAAAGRSAEQRAARAKRRPRGRGGG